MQAITRCFRFSRSASVRARQNVVGGRVVRNDVGLHARSGEDAVCLLARLELLSQQADVGVRQHECVERVQSRLMV